MITNKYNLRKKNRSVFNRVINDNDDDEERINNNKRTNKKRLSLG